MGSVDSLRRGTATQLQHLPPSMCAPASSTLALIPAYNEERFIGSLVLAVRLYVEHVVVIDDGSTDNTADIARRAGATVVRHQQNRGKAEAVNTGFDYARRMQPAAVVMLDGDGQHCADDIPPILAPVLTGEADIAVGSRFLAIKNEIPIYRQLGQHGLTLVTNLTSGVRLGDSQSGFRALSRRAVDLLSFRAQGFSIESEMQFLIRDHQLKVVEIPVKVIYKEPAKRNPFYHGMQVLNGIMRLIGQTRPLLFFGAIGLGLLFIGLMLGHNIISMYYQTGAVAFGYSLLTVVLCVAGVSLLFAGVILHSVRGLVLDLQQNLLSRMGNHHADPHDLDTLTMEPLPPASQPDDRSEPEDGMARELGK